MGLKEAFEAFGIALLADISAEAWPKACITLMNISTTLSRQNRLIKAERVNILALDLATQVDDKGVNFKGRLLRFQQLVDTGLWHEAETMWQFMNPMGRVWSRAIYRPGDSEYVYTCWLLYQNDLLEEHLAQSEQLAQEGKNRSVIRGLHCLRGQWQLEQSQWTPARDSFREAVRMAREVGQTDTKAETGLALAKFHLNQLTNPRHEAERLAQLKEPAHRFLAELWLAIGDREHATKHALAAYHWAWADGEPYVHRYELDKTTELLQRLGAAVPKLPPYDPATYVKFPWEDEVVAAIERLRAEKEAKQAQERAE